MGGGGASLFQRGVDAAGDGAVAVNDHREGAFAAIPYIEHEVRASKDVLASIREERKMAKNRTEDRAPTIRRPSYWDHLCQSAEEVAQ